MFWKCLNCNYSDQALKSYYWKCPVCGSPLELEYVVNGEISHSKNIWERYRGFIPFIPEKTRGEGLTPVVEEKIGIHKLMFKLEYLNPGGSFKDRGTALAIYYGFKMGFKKSIVDTSGNTGISVTLYSKLYGLKPTIIMPREAPIGKKKAILKIGGEIIEAEGRIGASKTIYEYVKDPDVYYVAHLWNPLYYIGHATIAYEVYEENGIPDYVIVPVGSGGLLLGVAHGFKVLKYTGLSKKIPRIIAVQGYSSQPLYEVLYGQEMKGEESTLADGIMVANPPRLSQLANILKSTSGEVVLVGNSEIQEAHRELWENGFLVEPTSAVTLAAYKKIKNKIPENSSILLVLTGSGLKTL